MKITIIVDKLGSAIHRLAIPIQRYNQHINIQICDLHPKRPSEDQMRRVLRNIQDSDIVDVHYWRSGELIKDQIKDKKKILFHFNPYDLEAKDWNEYNEVIVGNNEMGSKIPRAYVIPYGVDLDFFKFNDIYTTDKTVLMVANRIESKKGILEVAEVCEALGYKLILVGSISDEQYYNQLLKFKCVDFRKNISNDELRQAYYQSAILVCNSKDNFESGTLPILEAMACGVPVLTRPIGHVPDLYDGDNMMINEGEKEDIKLLSEHLEDLMENKGLRDKYRENAWKTVKNRSDKIMARQVCKTYYKIIGHPFVSIIIPTFDRPEVLVNALEGAVNQTYEAKEIIVVDSGNTKIEELVMAMKVRSKAPIRYIYFENKGEFTLPKARNIGIIEAQGEYIVFCDERIKMLPDAVSEFIKRSSFKTWLYGLKDDAKKGFVENFSCISKKDLVLNGMFNERIDCYGGCSQEIRTRYGLNGYLFELVATARAEGIAKSKSKRSKKADIARAKFNIFKLYE